jgi:hypothetical protein
MKSEFELAETEPVWTIPGEWTKNGLLHRVPLCPLQSRGITEAVYNRYAYNKESAKPFRSRRQNLAP